MESHVGDCRQGEREQTDSHKENSSCMSTASNPLAGASTDRLRHVKSLEIVGDLVQVVEAIKTLGQEGVEPGQIITVNVTLNPSPSPPRPTGIKRAASEDHDTATDVSTRKRPKQEHLQPKAADRIVCGNCRGINHRAAFCVKIGKSGWVECCPKCDSTEHMYEACPKRLSIPKKQRSKEDFIYLIFNRQNKPPIKSLLKLGKLIINERVRLFTNRLRDYPMALPYSSRFARQEARQNGSAAYTYAHVGNPTLEAKHRTAQLTRARITLKDASNDNSVMQQAWSAAEEIFDPKLDAPMPVLRPTRGKVPSRTYSTRHAHAHTHTKHPKREQRQSLKPFAPASLRCGGHVLEKCACP